MVGPFEQGGENVAVRQVEDPMAMLSDNLAALSGSFTLSVCAEPTVTLVEGRAKALARTGHRLMPTCAD